MISAWVMMVTWMVGAEATLLDQPAYLDSYSVQDSCQFSLCGPEYGQEFLGGAPLVGSCSGDCHLLASNLNTDRFTREWLWSSCADMCSQKFDFVTHRHYKPRFECMESCFHSYQAISPHHSIARYCIKVTCPPGLPDLHRVDCFSSCSQHVAASVSQQDW